MSDDNMVSIEVDGRQLQAEAGSLLIEVTDAAGIIIPRFCYHRKLSIAANCRMCLVEVEKVPKPLPACATPVAEGMKVHTHSPLALAAQKGTMEFLLINHPLDCPICDQGGECELQDISLGYGGDISRFSEGKRVVPDEDIGPLIATDFTRCIHCTRCVRFGAEIAGIRELGATGRGEHMTIGTYVGKTIDSELSGNIIDICPVGSLTAKPSQFQARAWEMTQRQGIAPHDSVGSNIYLHLRRNRIIRVHPMDNESINECWISDRDRFSYQGLNSEDRLTTPMIKKSDEWVVSDWQEALDVAAKGMKQARSSGDQLAALISPSATLEEMYLAQKLMRGLDSDNIDCRLRQTDFRGNEPSLPWLGIPIAAFDQLDSTLLIGSDIRKDQPILGHRLRKAAMRGGSVCYVNPFEIELTYPAEQLVSSPAGMLKNLAALARALGAEGELINTAEVAEIHTTVAQRLKAGTSTAVLLGNMAASHPDYAILRSLAAAIAHASGAILGFLPDAANSIGARVAGAIPRGEANARSLLEEPRKGYLLMGVEPGYDFWSPALAEFALSKAEFVVALTAFRSPSLEAVADLLLPMAAFTETSGTFINAEGTWQSFKGCVSPREEARPAWKILRVLGNLLNLDGFDQNSSEDVLQEVQTTANGLKPDNSINLNEAGDLKQLMVDTELVRIGDVPIYAQDPLVRRASALQQTKDAAKASIRINPAVAARVGLGQGDRATLMQDGGRTVLPVEIDKSLPEGCVRIPSGLDGTEKLGGQFGPVTLEKI